MLQTISAAFHEGGWGMWLILVTSIFIIGIIVERSVYLFKASVDKDKLLALLKSQVMAGNVQGVVVQITTLAGPAGRFAAPKRPARSAASTTANRTSMDGEVRSSYSTSASASAERQSRHQCTGL